MRAHFLNIAVSRMSSGKYTVCTLGCLLLFLEVLYNVYLRQGDVMCQEIRYCRQRVKDKITPGGTVTIIIRYHGNQDDMTRFMSMLNFLSNQLV